MDHYSRGSHRHRRPAVVAVQVVVMSGVLFGMAALTIDVGMMYNAKADLQTAADVAALAGVSAYTSDAMFQVRLDPDETSLFYDVLSAARSGVDNFAAQNPSYGTSTTLVSYNDVATGWINTMSRTSLIDTTVDSEDYNAVRVVTRRNSGGPNGAIPLLFSAIFGRHTAEATATAVAAFDDRVAGYDTAAGPGILLPFTIHEDVFASELVGGLDNYGYDGDDEEVTTDADGIREIKLYPYVIVPGNFGLLNIGTPNQGVPALQEQIENGVDPDDVETEVGTTVLTFYNEDDDPITYEITGNPGLKVALESSIEERIGEVVGFLLHDHVIENGANSIYTITEIRFGRVMDVKLTGGPSSQGFWIQPVSFAGSGVVVTADAPSSGGLAGRIVLVR